MLTEKIANFVSGIRTEDIPQEALDKARMGMTDFIGVALAGSQEEVGRLIREYGSRMGVSPRRVSSPTIRRRHPRWRP